MINEYDLYGKSKETFDKLFQKEDPWNLSSGVEKLRYKITAVNIFKFCNSLNKNILELGCAEGIFTEYLSNEGYTISAVDISETAINRAEKKNLNNVTYHCSDMIDFARNNDLKNFGIILIMESLYYLDANSRKILLSVLSDKVNMDTLIIATLPIKRNNKMFPNENEFVNLFRQNNFIQIQNSEILSLIGRSGKIALVLKYILLIKYFFLLFELIFPNKINQRLFVFKKDKTNIL